MSVLGEFTRLVDGCIEFLEDSDAASAQHWADALRAARSLAHRDLFGAAERVLALHDEAPSIVDIEFSAARERREFRVLCDHMLALMRVIAGRPAGEARRE